MNKRLCVVCAVLMSVPGCSSRPGKTTSATHSAPANPITASEKGLYSFVSGAVIGPAEKMPEENYSFKPTPEFVASVSSSAIKPTRLISSARRLQAKKTPVKGIEKTKTSKADLVAALKDGVAYCNKAYGAMTDAKGSQVIKFFNFDMARLTLLSLNTAHADEHYGNMVTYLRLRELCLRPVRSNPHPRQSKAQPFESGRCGLESPA